MNKIISIIQNNQLKYAKLKLILAIIDCVLEIIFCVEKCQYLAVHNHFKIEKNSFKVFCQKLPSNRFIQISSVHQTMFDTK